ncbi:ORF3 [Chimpanzee stool associated circular ssDNA virus]|nr:ORF3 [Chimpanzee stool associated circular ssDNA virus]ADB24825.1 ORF3 [Chimpanzee stool associated circular ssDNA virus]
MYLSEHSSVQIEIGPSHPNTALRYAVQSLTTSTRTLHLTCQCPYPPLPSSSPMTHLWISRSRKILNQRISSALVCVLCIVVIMSTDTTSVNKCIFERPSWTALYKHLWDFDANAHIIAVRLLVTLLA